MPNHSRNYKTNLTLPELFQRAQSEEFGLVIETDDPTGLMADLYKTKLKPPNLSIHIPPTEGILHLIHKTVNLDE